MYKVLLASRADYMDLTGEIPFIFKKAGCIVDVYCTPKGWLLSNSFHDKWIDAPIDEKEFQHKLIAIADSNEYNWIALMDDECVKTMNSCIITEDTFRKILPMTKMENRDILSSKIGLSTVCKKYNIPTPGYVNYSEVSDLEQINKALNYPILLKEDFSFSGHGIQFCEDASQLPGCLEKVRNTNNLVLQEFIKGKDIGVEALFKDGELVTYNAAEVKEYMNNTFSFTTKRIYAPNKDIEDHLRTLGKSVGLNGFASIGYIYHPERKIYYLIEVDARVNSWMAYGRFTGHSFTEGVRRITQWDTASNVPVSKGQTIEVAIFDRDVRRCVKYKDFKGLMKWVFNYKGYWKYIPMYDRKLFGRIMKKMLYDFLKIKY